MNLTVTNGTARQQGLVHRALGACDYAFQYLPVDVTVTFVTGLTNCSLAHTYMCTTQLTAPDPTDASVIAQYLIQIESWADDPNAIENRGLPDPFSDIDEFFIESFVHEMGHVVHFFKLTTGDLQTRAAECFTYNTDAHRGNLGDWSGGESTLATWADRIEEAIAEWFKLTFLSTAKVYWNRTNWNLSPADFETLMKLLIPSGYMYERPIALSDFNFQLIETTLGDLEFEAFGGGGYSFWLASVSSDGMFATSRYEPYIFGPAQSFLHIDSPNTFSRPLIADQDGEDVTVFYWPDSRGIFVASQDVSEPGYRSHFGLFGLSGDRFSWSGWRALRKLWASIDYTSAQAQAAHEWAVVQLNEEGWLFLDNPVEGVDVTGYFQGVNALRTAENYDRWTQASPGNDGGDAASAPWGVDISIIQPGPGGAVGDVKHPLYAPLYDGFVGVGREKETTVFSAGGDSTLRQMGDFGRFTNFMRIMWDTAVWQEPNAVELGPPADPGGWERDTNTPTYSQVAANIAQSWDTCRVRDMGRSYAFACSPQRSRDTIEFEFFGFADVAQRAAMFPAPPPHALGVRFPWWGPDWSGFQELSGWLWPVKTIDVPLPAYPARNSGFGIPGPPSGGSVRASTEPTLARRQTQVVRRVSGGRSIFSRQTPNIGMARSALSGRSQSQANEHRYAWGGAATKGSASASETWQRRRSPNWPTGQAIGWGGGNYWVNDIYGELWDIAPEDRNKVEPLVIPTSIEPGDLMLLALAATQTATWGEEVGFFNYPYLYGWIPLATMPTTGVHGEGWQADIEGDVGRERWLGNTIVYARICQAGDPGTVLGRMKLYPPGDPELPSGWGIADDDPTYTSGWNRDFFVWVAHLRSYICGGVDEAITQGYGNDGDGYYLPSGIYVPPAPFHHELFPKNRPYRVSDAAPTQVSFFQVAPTKPPHELNADVPFAIEFRRHEGENQLCTLPPVSFPRAGETLTTPPFGLATEDFWGVGGSMYRLAELVGDPLDNVDDPVFGQLLVNGEPTDDGAASASLPPNFVDASNLHVTLKAGQLSAPAPPEFELVAVSASTLSDYHAIDGSFAIDPHNGYVVSATPGVDLSRIGHKYALQWRAPGKVGDGYKLRAKLALGDFDNEVGSPFRFALSPNTSDAKTDGLMFWAGFGSEDAGWTSKYDTIFFSDTTGQPDGWQDTRTALETWPGVTPVGGTPAQRWAGEEILVTFELWRNGLDLILAYYDINDPDEMPPIWQSHYAVAAGDPHYNPHTASYFTVIFDWLGKDGINRLGQRVSMGVKELRLYKCVANADNWLRIPS